MIQSLPLGVRDLLPFASTADTTCEPRRRGVQNADRKSKNRKPGIACACCYSCGNCQWSPGALLGGSLGAVNDPGPGVGSVWWLLRGHQLDECMGADHPCSERTMQNIDHDLARARADLDVARTQEHSARDQFETRLQSAGDYGERFGSIYEEIYRSVEVRIILSD